MERVMKCFDKDCYAYWNLCKNNCAKYYKTKRCKERISMEQKLKSEEAYEIVKQSQEDHESLILKAVDALRGLEPMKIAEFYSQYLPEMKNMIKELEQAAEQELINSGEKSFVLSEGEEITIGKSKTNKVIDKYSTLNAFFSVNEVAIEDTIVADLSKLVSGCNYGAAKKLDPNLVETVEKDKIKVSKKTPETREFLANKKKLEIMDVFK